MVVSRLGVIIFGLKKDSFFLPEERIQIYGTIQIDRFTFIFSVLTTDVTGYFCTDLSDVLNIINLVYFHFIT